MILMNNNIGPIQGVSTLSTVLAQYKCNQCVKQQFVFCGGGQLNLAKLYT